MNKERIREEFQINLSQEILNQPYSLQFVGVVEYIKHNPNPGAKHSDWDYHGYNEYDDVKFRYIVKTQDESEDEILLCDVLDIDFQKFSERLNIQFGF